MVAICVVYMKQGQEFVEIIHQNPDRMNSVMQTGKWFCVVIPANSMLYGYPHRNFFEILRQLVVFFSCKVFYQASVSGLYVMPLEESVMKRKNCWEVKIDSLTYETAFDGLIIEV